MAKEKFVIAVKNVQPGGPILLGKVLGEFRKREFADNDFFALANREVGAGNSWRVGIFQNGKLVPN